MVKQDTPENKISFDGLDAEALKATAAMFQEALGNAGLKAEQVFKIKEAEKPSTPVIADQKAVIEKWTPIYSTAKAALEDAGVKFETSAPNPIDAKFSEMKAEVNAQLEKISEAKFGEQVAAIHTIAKDFPLDSISKLDVPWSTKVEITNAMFGIAKTTSETVSKLQAEVDKLTKELKDVSAYSPADEKKQGSGADRIALQISKMGIPDPRGNTQKQEKTD